jgi:hypothetical protein
MVLSHFSGLQTFKGENVDADNSNIHICIRKVRVIIFGIYIRIRILLLLSTSVRLMWLLFIIRI